MLAVHPEAAEPKAVPPLLADILQGVHRRVPGVETFLPHLR